MDLDESEFVAAKVAIAPLELPVYVERNDGYVRVMFHELTDDDVNYLTRIVSTEIALRWARVFARKLAGR